MPERQEQPRILVLANDRFKMGGQLLELFLGICEIGPGNHALRWYAADILSAAEEFNVRLVSR